MSNDEGENDTAGAAEDAKAKAEPEVEKKVIPPTQKGTKNKQGDYIVEKFEITDFRDDMKARKANESEEEDDSSDDNFYGDEDDNDNKKEDKADDKKDGKLLQIALNGRTSPLTIFHQFILSFIWFTNLNYHIEKPQEKKKSKKQ